MRASRYIPSSRIVQKALHHRLDLITRQRRKSWTVGLGRELIYTAEETWAKKNIVMGLGFMHGLHVRIGFPWDITFFSLDKKRPILLDIRDEKLI